MKNLSVKTALFALRKTSLAVVGRNLLVAVILTASLNAYYNMLWHNVGIPAEGTATELSLDKRDVVKLLPFTLTSSGVISKFVYPNGQ